MRGADAGSGSGGGLRGGGPAGGRLPRIGIVAACRFPAPRGSQVLIDGMAAALAATGADVRLLAPIAPGCTRPYAMHSLARAGELPEAEPRLRGLRRFVEDLRFTTRLREVVARERIDVLHAHNYEALVASLRVKALTGVPVVFHAHAVLSDELPLYAAPGSLPSAAARRLGAWFDQVFPRRADLVVALCSDVASHLERCGTDPQRIVVVPPGLDAASPIRRSTAARPRAVFSGNLDRYQNLELLLEAWAEVERRVPAASLSIVTHELERSVLPARGTPLCRVEVVRARTLAEVGQEWARATVGVSPRASWSGYPVKTLNYMAAGLPTVAVAASAKGVRNGETGWVAREATATGLATALCEALDDPATAAVRGRRARQSLQDEHGWPALAIRLLGISQAAASRTGDTLSSRPASG